MELNSEKIDAIAKLSRIELDDSERENFKKQLIEILQYVAKLNEVDLDSIEPTLYTSSLRNVFREDSLQPSYKRKCLTDVSPSSVNGFYKVPKIIE